MIIAIIVFVIILLLSLTNTGKTSTVIQESTVNLNDTFYQKYNSEGLTLVRDLENHYLGASVPENFPDRDYFVKFIPSLEEGTLLTFNNLFPIIGITIENPEYGSDDYKAKEHFSNLIGVLSLRKNADQAEVYEGSNETEAAEKHGINLFKDEILILSNCFTTWKEEKTKTTSITYGGTRLNSGKGGLKTVFGHMNIFPNKETYFSTFDSGTTFITNKRIIFVGNKNRNKTIRMDKIVNVEFFKDGIYIGKENGVSPLITVFELSPNPKEPWSYTQQLTSQIPEMVSYINRILHNDVIVKAA
jgi:hypothetical protein